MNRISDVIFSDIGHVEPPVDWNLFLRQLSCATARHCTNLLCFESKLFQQRLRRVSDVVATNPTSKTPQSQSLTMNKHSTISRYRRPQHVYWLKLNTKFWPSFSHLNTFSQINHHESLSFRWHIIWGPIWHHMTSCIRAEDKAWCIPGQLLQSAERPQCRVVT